MEQVVLKLDLEGWVGFQQADVRVGVGGGERSSMSKEKCNTCSWNAQGTGVTGSQSTWWEAEEKCFKLHDKGPSVTGCFHFIW